jgi:ABC-type oligopeptide transport system substrate-binding subunit
VAQDYVYSLKRYYDPRYNSSDLYLFESLKLPGLSEQRELALKTRKPFDYDVEVEGVRALGRYSFRITLGVSDPRFIYLLAAPQNLGAVAREVVEFYGDEIGAHPVGTGAFRLKSWRRASRIELERSPGMCARCTTAARRPTTPSRSALPRSCKASGCRWPTRWWWTSWKSRSRAGCRS